MSAVKREISILRDTRKRKLPAVAAAIVGGFLERTLS
jgi:hypothetical protein